MTTSIALLFPGSGSQYKGMMRTLHDDFPIVRNTLQEADDILGTALSKVILEGGTAKLNKIGNMLPAICVASVAHYRLYMERVGVFPVYMAGHSLGEYSALICSGALSFKAGLELVRYRSQLAEEVMEITGGSMSIIKNINPAMVEQLATELNAEGMEVSVACRNSHSQVSVSGVDEALQELEKRVTDAEIDAQVIHLIGSAPYHCSLMRSRAEGMAQELRSYEWRMPQCHVISNVTGRPYVSIEDIWEQLPRQLYQPVEWLESITFLMRGQVGAFIEMGPQNVLKNIMPEITDKAKIYAHDEKIDRAQVMATYGSQNISTPTRANTETASEDKRAKAISMCLTHAVTTRNHNESAQGDIPSLQLYEEMKRIKNELDGDVLSMSNGYVAQAFQMLNAVFEGKETPAAERELRLQQIKDKTGLEPQTETFGAGRGER